MSRSRRRRRSPSPARPHHAGVAYRMDEAVVGLVTRWSSCGWRPWVRRSLNANIEEEQVLKTCETWSVMVNLALRGTPRDLSVVTPQSALEFCPIHCPNGRLGQDLGFGGFAFAIKLPELLNRNLAAVRAKLGQTSCFPNGPQIWCPKGQ